MIVIVEQQFAATQFYNPAPGDRLADLETTVTDVLATAGKLSEATAAGNEANTRALLIDPLLGALGWNLLDFQEVEREFRVYDGTFLDYALRVGRVPKLFVEAKAMNKTLADKTFIAQTVNYANNEGVLWCVLTNGLEYHVYKSNEPVEMERKLLFQIDLRDAREASDRADVLRSLRALSRQAVERGELDSWGEQVFVDERTRAALVNLAREPSPGFLRSETPQVLTRPAQSGSLSLLLQTHAPLGRGDGMRLALTSFLSSLVLMLFGLVGSASADPVNSPRVDFGTIVCGGTSYILVSPFGAPVSHALTANGSDSTTVAILIVDKAGTRFPQNLLTLCTAYPPPPDQPFQAYFLISPVG